ncbi:unnamed protein product [Bursaphelenchus xylophilus]|uniref:(pine wood nematode) hypothetical protein n=1 Tax=Bursaphelenchus xylophilus TaxID=6326 RepID=A0A1I7SLW6_BURXY|nr:unnamed protein product [Bursaphelenchus xylophilus]CAG9129888.1 unnamed protein product [Bursaphelenchus xylophilus]
MGACEKEGDDFEIKLAVTPEPSSKLLWYLLCLLPHPEILLEILLEDDAEHPDPLSVNPTGTFSPFGGMANNSILKTFQTLTLFI